MLALSLLAASLCASTAAPSQEAKALNSAGYGLYKKADYDGALAKFQAAYEADPEYALPYYNAACTLGLIRKRGDICDASKDTILDLLEKAVELDPRRRERAKVDPDLDPVRDTIRYQKLIGLDPARAADVPKILRAVVWYMPGQGAYGPMSSVRFLADGTLAGWRLEMDEDGGVRRVELRGGRYKLVRNQVTVEATDGSKSVLTLTPEGALVDDKGQMVYTDNTDECSA